MGVLYQSPQCGKNLLDFAPRKCVLNVPKKWAKMRHLNNGDTHYSGYVYGTSTHVVSVVVPIQTISSTIYSEIGTHSTRELEVK